MTEDDDVDHAGEPEPERPVERWRRNTASGAVAASIALGLQQVFDPEKKRDSVAVEQEAPDEPLGPQEVELHFDPNDRAATFVVVRPPPEDSAG